MEKLLVFYLDTKPKTGIPSPESANNPLLRVCLNSLKQAFYSLFQDVAESAVGWLSKKLRGISSSLPSLKMKDR